MAVCSFTPGIQASVSLVLAELARCFVYGNSALSCLCLSFASKTTERDDVLLLCTRGPHKHTRSTLALHSVNELHEKLLPNQDSVRNMYSEATFSV